MRQLEDRLPKSAFSFFCLVMWQLATVDLIFLVLCIAIGQSTYVILSSLLGVLIDRTVLEGPQISYLIWSFPILWAMSIFFNSLGKFYSSSLLQDVRKISKDIIFRYIIHLPSAVYHNRDPGEVEHLMQEISLGSRYVFGESLAFFIRISVILILSLFIVGNYSFFLVLFFLLWTAMYIPTSYLNSKASVKFVAASLMDASAVSAATVDILNNHELIPAFGTAEKEIIRFNILLDKERASFKKAQYKIDLADFFHKFLLLLLPFGIAFYLAYSDRVSVLSGGEIATLFSLTIIFISQLGDLGRGILGFFEVKERVKTALTKLAIPLEMHRDMKIISSSPPSSWNIAFEDIHFAYGNREVIKGINLQIQEREKIGIVGYSGAGKSTLLKLLRGYILPTQGQIWIGDRNINTIDQRTLTENIVEVSQTIPIFHRSIRENVAYGCKQVTDEEIWSILEKAQIVDYVWKLPEQLDTIVGVNGQKLSGGEKARIAIARALIRKAKIIILDEATTSLDSESEYYLQKGLEELIFDRTLIAVAHRLSTLRKMDRLVVIDKGQIIAIGTHEKLQEQSALYQQLWNRQVLI